MSKQKIKTLKFSLSIEALASIERLKALARPTENGNMFFITSHCIFSRSILGCHEYP